MGFRESSAGGGGGRVARVRGRTFIKNDCEYIMREFLGYWKLLFGRKMETTQFSARRSLFGITLLRWPFNGRIRRRSRFIARYAIRRERNGINPGEIDIRGVRKYRRDATRDATRWCGRIRRDTRPPSRESLASDSRLLAHRGTR